MIRKGDDEQNVPKKKSFFVDWSLRSFPENMSQFYFFLADSVPVGPVGPVGPCMGPKIEFFVFSYISYHLIIISVSVRSQGVSSEFA